jgi:hypothetical protein
MLTAVPPEMRAISSSPENTELNIGSILKSCVDVADLKLSEPMPELSELSAYDFYSSALLIFVKSALGEKFEII